MAFEREAINYNLHFLIISRTRKWLESLALSRPMAHKWRIGFLGARATTQPDQTGIELESSARLIGPIIGLVGGGSFAFGLTPIAFAKLISSPRALKAQLLAEGNEWAFVFVMIA